MTTVPVLRQYDIDKVYKHILVSFIAEHGLETGIGQDIDITLYFLVTKFRIFHDNKI